MVFEYRKDHCEVLQEVLRCIAVEKNVVYDNFRAHIRITRFRVRIPGRFPCNATDGSEAVMTEADCYLWCVCVGFVPRMYVRRMLTLQHILHTSNHRPIDQSTNPPIQTMAIIGNSSRVLKRIVLPLTALLFLLLPSYYSLSSSLRIIISNAAEPPPPITAVVPVSRTTTSATIVHPQQQQQQQDEQERPVIAVLVTNREQDHAELRRAIRSMDMYLSDDNKTPLLFFQEGDIDTDQMARLANFTTRPISFPFVNFTDFPQGFNPFLEKSTFKKRKNKWGYHFMCHFWVSRIWDHPAIQPYTTIMRMDTDSCFVDKVDEPLPFLGNSSLIYKAPSQYRSRHWREGAIPYHPSLFWKSGQLEQKGFCTDLFNLTVQFVEKYNLTIRHVELWNIAVESMQNYSSIPIINNNLEVDRISFFQQPMVRQYHHMVADEAPYSIFRYRWGDAIVRFLTMAIFAHPDQVDLRPIASYGHKHRCKWLPMPA